MPGYKEHLFTGFVTAGIIVAILHFLFHLNLIDANLLTTLVVTTLIFSVISDIDHKSSNISGFLHFFSILAVIAIIADIIPFNFSSTLILLSLLGLEIYHWNSAKNNWEHRQFPHSLTFGLFALVVLFLITFSWIAVIIGAVTFLSHIVIDDYFDQKIVSAQ